MEIEKASGSNSCTSDRDFTGQDNEGWDKPSYSIHYTKNNFRSWKYIEAGKAPVYVGATRRSTPSCGNTSPVVLQPGEAAYVRCVVVGKPQWFAQWEVVRCRPEVIPSFRPVMAGFSPHLVDKIVEWLAARQAGPRLLRVGQFSVYVNIPEYAEMPEGTRVVVASKWYRLSDHYSPQMGRDEEDLGRENMEEVVFLPNK